ILDHPPQDRERVLRQLCGGDEALEVRVRALLGGHGRGAGILEEAPLPAWIREAGEATADYPATIGRYRILREIGKGGMGRVYLAERADGHFSRRVALKIIPRVDEDLRARVVAERQILASLQHPNIASLLDGGVTQDGRPYLVMDYVAGLPIDLYCDRSRLSLRERLRVFLTVLGAVQHAHHNLVVHRDLKPSNILVSESGEVKLLDFGIAKLLAPSLGIAEAPVTRTEDRVLTPDYASPEQVRGNGITTASDIYSLGVVLYELLTGSRPYAVTDAALHSMVKAVCEQDPPPPSAMVMDGHDGPSEAASPGYRHQKDIAGARRTTSAGLLRSLKGDLDAIVMKALRKEPGRRYTSVELLAQDIRYYLDGLPVEARRGTGWYRIRKLVNRHRRGAMAAVVVAISLLGGAGAAAWQAGVAGRERDRARAALRESEEVTEFLLGLFEASDPLEAPGGTVTVLDLLRRGEQRARALEGEPVVRARLLQTMARARHSLGQYREAEIIASEAVSSLETELGLDHHEMASALTHLGFALSAAGHYDSARVVLERALESEERWHDSEVLEMGDILETLARVTVYLGDLPRAEALASRALDIREAFLGRGDPSTLNTLSALASIYRYRGRYDQAEEAFREVLARRRSLESPNLSRLAGDMLQIGDLLRDQGGDLEEAEALYREAMAILRGGSPNADRNFVWGLTSLASLLELRGELGEAEDLLSRALEMRRRIFGDVHPLVAESLGDYGAFLTRHDQAVEAELLFRQAIDINLQTVGPQHSRHAGTLSGLAMALMRQGRLEEADSLARASIRIRTNAQGRRTGIVAQNLAAWADIKTRMGRYREAEGLLNEALDIVRESGTKGFLPGRIHAAFARMYEATGDAEKAARHRDLSIRDP
ncbi:MAG: serine/threonine-protein kinase, partial [Longimicrobiales bacterium]